MNIKIIDKITGKKSDHYSYDRIDKTKSLYNLIIGQRSNGKTYGALKKILDKKQKNGRPSAYIRRYDESIRPKNIQDLFNPFNSQGGNGYIEQITNDRYNCTSYKSNKFYFARYDDEQGKIVETSDDVILYTAALNVWETTKGSDKGAINYIVFDEFMTRELYLADEFVKFMNVISSFVRDRDNVVIYMLANTVSKQCPYFREFGIKNIEKMKRGEIQIVKYDTDGLQLAVEYCDGIESTKKINKYFAFDNPRLQMITGGEWEIPHYPRCPISFNKNDIKHCLYIMYDDKIMRADFVRDTETHGLFLNIHPHYTDNKLPDNAIIYCREPDTNPRHIHDLRDKQLPIAAEFVNLIISRKIFYSDNDTGDLFNNFILTFSGKQK